MIFGLLSCDEEPVYHQEAKFQEMVDHLVLDCPDIDGEDYFKATINGMDACYYDGYDGMKKELSYRNTFVTKGSSFSTNQNYSDFGHTIYFGITSDLTTKYQDWISFRTPKFSANVSKEHYLDSLFSIPYHKLRDRNNPDLISVRLNMLDRNDKIKSSNGGVIYSFTTDSGYQGEDSFIHFVKVEKIQTAGITYYKIEMKVQCDLYYKKEKDGYTPYGKEGLWGRLDNGVLKMNVLL